MKYSLLTSLFVAVTTFSLAQLPYVGPNQTFVFPIITNHFINSANITWALDTEETYSFSESNKFDDEDIFKFLISKAISSKLEVYDPLNIGIEDYENATYSSYAKFPNRKFTKKELNFVLADSLKTIKFHEIFYLDNYLLKCKIISAAPMTNFTSGGVSLGLQNIFFCCKNIKDTISIGNDKDIVHIKRIKRALNFDSIQGAKLIKQTYGFNLIQSLWHGASLGSIKLFDTKSQKTIDAKNVMNYSYLDSVQVPFYDSTGSVIGYVRSAGQTAFPYKLTNSIQFTQDIYFDSKQNIFFTTISDCFLFVKNWDDTNYKMILEKRFKIL